MNLLTFPFVLFSTLILLVNSALDVEIQQPGLILLDDPPSNSFLEPRFFHNGFHNTGMERRDAYVALNNGSMSSYGFSLDELDVGDDGEDEDNANDLSSLVKRGKHKHGKKQHHSKSKTRKHKKKNHHGKNHSKHRSNQHRRHKSKAKKGKGVSRHTSFSTGGGLGGILRAVITWYTESV
ncbi:hypothetical protein BT69DRAFT_437813 [Atractiella rhizophila]|nr:hypothetical protein BT69DRAFT_437813 [Atractiella rhizophila]